MPVTTTAGRTRLKPVKPGQVGKRVRQPGDLEAAVLVAGLALHSLGFLILVVGWMMG